jgi:hypothetical protein
MYSRGASKSNRSRVLKKFARRSTPPGLHAACRGDDCIKQEGESATSSLIRAPCITSVVSETIYTA